MLDELCILKKHKYFLKFKIHHRMSKKVDRKLLWKLKSDMLGNKFGVLKVHTLST